MSAHQAHLAALRANHALLAWTGGAVPQPLTSASPLERLTVRALFREQVQAWKAFWGNLPDKDTAKTFWRRARYDACATHR